MDTEHFAFGAHDITAHGTCLLLKKCVRHHRLLEQPGGDQGTSHPFWLDPATQHGSPRNAFGTKGYVALFTETERTEPAGSVEAVTRTSAVLFGNCGWAVGN